MRYELYGVLSNTGVNEFKGAFSSLKQAIAASRSLVREPIFAIVEKQRKHSVALGVSAGLTGGPLMKTRMLCACKSNPIKDEQAGREFFKGFLTV